MQIEKMLGLHFVSSLIELTNHKSEALHGFLHLGKKHSELQASGNHVSVLQLEVVEFIESIGTGIDCQCLQDRCGDMIAGDCGILLVSFVHIPNHEGN